LKRSVGYSGRPLAAKLGLKPGFRLSLVGGPPGYRSALGRLPDGAKILGHRAANLDFIHIFVADRGELIRELPRAKQRIRPDGMLWVSWPKRASGVKTDLSEQVIREAGLASGLVDVKVAAIDNVWSGLKFVYRLKDRRST
jgi:hypothetical protein